jgi:hypothetical protein
MLRIASWQAFSQRRQAAAQTRQCSCSRAWRSHSSLHRRHAIAQVSSMRRITSSFDPVRRDAIAPVAAQTSAQSRSSRMH